jgi:hypothetical protein
MVDSHKILLHYDHIKHRLCYDTLRLIYHKHLMLFRATRKVLTMFEKPQNTWEYGHVLSDIKEGKIHLTNMDDLQKPDDKKSNATNSQYITMIQSGTFFEGHYVSDAFNVSEHSSDSDDHPYWYGISNVVEHNSDSDDHPYW